MGVTGNCVLNCFRNIIQETPAAVSTLNPRFPDITNSLADIFWKYAKYEYLHFQFRPCNVNQPLLHWKKKKLCYSLLATCVPSLSHQVVTVEVSKDATIPCRRRWQADKTFVTIVDRSLSYMRSVLVVRSPNKHTISIDPCASSPPHRIAARVLRVPD